jgi:hypothetical protein
MCGHTAEPTTAATMKTTTTMPPSVMETDYHSFDGRLALDNADVAIDPEVGEPLHA